MGRDLNSEEVSMLSRICFTFAVLVAVLVAALGSIGSGATAGERLPIPDGLVVLTFDDGNKSDIRTVAPTLERYGFGATFYITRGLGSLTDHENFVTWDEVKELHRRGFEIGNHTKTHPNLARQNETQVREEIDYIEKECRDRGLPKPTTFCYPGFQHAPHVVKVASELGFVFARRGVGPEFRDGGRGGRGPAYDPRVDHPLLVPTTGYDGPEWGMDDLRWAVDQARDGKIAVLCFHGIPSKLHPWVHTDPADFEKYMKYLKERDCTVISMADLTKYVDPSRSPKDAYEALARKGAIDIGGRRELFVDRQLIDRLEGSARLELHRPTPREIVFRFDQPWEGIYSGYETVLEHEGGYRLYYRGLPVAKHSLDTEVTCVAESRDGIRWTRPKLEQYQVGGHQANNVVLARSRGCHNLAPFVDRNPRAPKSERYKALGGTGAPGLLAFVSPDGLSWKQLRDDPVITKGAFDSQNNAFWSVSEKKYVCYFRVFRDGKRWIARTTSENFVDWTEPVDLELDGKPRQHLYTNTIDAYPRAPHLYLGMPTRFFPGRRAITKEEELQLGTPKDWNYANDCTDIVLASTRGGTNFGRTFLEAFIRPGQDLRNWTSRANYAARGFLRTSPTELSIYVKHNAGYPSVHLRRYTLRPDGFVSVRAGFSGGTLTTKPLYFDGSRLTINYSTSAAGGLRVELRDSAGRAIPGFTLADCPEIIGDRLDQVVTWRGGADVSKLAGKVVRLRFELADADLFSFRFEAAR